MKTRVHERGFQAVVMIVLTLLVLFTLMPFVILFASSFTSESALSSYGYQFWPREFSLEAYEYIADNSETIFRAYGITIFVAVTGTALSLFITALLAYPLSRRDFSRRGLFTFLVFFTMLFNGGMVPYYIMWTQFLHIKNTLAALIFPGLLMNAFSVLLMKNYFVNNVPMEIIEAAQIDGAGEGRILFNIVLPLSKPILATLGLMAVLAYWNDWTNGLYFVNDSSLFSIQVLLNNILNDIQFLLTHASVATAMGTNVASGIPSVSIRMAIAVLGILPIMILFPFFQSYFVKGITIGAVKG